MIRSLVLFVHITGVLTMCAGLALEAFGVESAGRATPRISGIAVALTVLSGFYLGARFGVLGDEWMQPAISARTPDHHGGTVTWLSSSAWDLQVRSRFDPLATPRAEKNMMTRVPIGGAFIIRQRSI